MEIADSYNFLRWLIKDANLTIKTKTIHFLPLKDKRRNVNLVVNYTLLTNTNHKTLQRCNLFRMSTENSFKDEKIELPYDPAVPLLGIHTKETRSERHTCTPMFIIARTWKQPRCPSA